MAAIRYGTPQTAPLCCMAALKVLGMKGPVSLGVDIATQALNIPNIPQRLQMQIELERRLLRCVRSLARRLACLLRQRSLSCLAYHSVAVTF